MLVSPKSAEDATAIWDARKRRVSAALSVDDRDDTGGATLITSTSRRWRPAGRVLMTRNAWGARRRSRCRRSPARCRSSRPHQPSLTRPFGRSESPERSCTTQTPRCARCSARRSAPVLQRPAAIRLKRRRGRLHRRRGQPRAGVDGHARRLLALSRRGRRASAGRAVHAAVDAAERRPARSIAQMMASESSLDVGSLGIVQDNPSSAEAIRPGTRAQREDRELALDGAHADVEAHARPRREDGRRLGGADGEIASVAPSGAHGRPRQGRRPRRRRPASRPCHASPRPTSSPSGWATPDQIQRIPHRLGPRRRWPCRPCRPTSWP